MRCVVQPDARSDSVALGPVRTRVVEARHAPAHTTEIRGRHARFQVGWMYRNGLAPERARRRLSAQPLSSFPQIHGSRHDTNGVAVESLPFDGDLNVRGESRERGRPRDSGLHVLRVSGSDVPPCRGHYCVALWRLRHRDFGRRPRHRSSTRFQRIRRPGPVSRLVGLLQRASSDAETGSPSGDCGDAMVERYARLVRVLLRGRPERARYAGYLGRTLCPRPDPRNRRNCGRSAVPHLVQTCCFRRMHPRRCRRHPGRAVHSTWSRAWRLGCLVVHAQPATAEHRDPDAHRLGRPRLVGGPSAIDRVAWLGRDSPHGGEPHIQLCSGARFVHRDEVGQPWLDARRRDLRAGCIRHHPRDRSASSTGTSRTDSESPSGIASGAPAFSRGSGIGAGRRQLWLVG